MLRENVAEERLKAFVLPDWKERRLAAVRKLSGKVRKPAEFFIQHLHPGFRLNWEKHEKDKIEAANQLDELSPRERFKLFEALFPKIALHVEQAWLLLASAPYQQGYHRKAFRAPNSLLTSRYSRFSWLYSLWGETRNYDQGITWFAAWAPYLGYGSLTNLGSILAAAIDAGGSEGEAIFDILCTSARGEHEIGAMGRHVIRGLLMASRPDGWEFIEKLLLAAQLQEGLRQVILETIDEAHPRTFRRMLQLILDHNLVRFSSTIRAVDVWFGFLFESVDARQATEVIAEVLRLLDDSKAREDALANGNGRQAYLALWTLAFMDAVSAVEPASRLLTDADVERRFASTHLLAQLGLVVANQALLVTLDDPDLRVLVRTVGALQSQADDNLKKIDLFERLEQAIPRFPVKRTILKPILWPWLELTADREIAARLLVKSLGDRSPKRLIPYLPTIDSYTRSHVAELLGKQGKMDAETRKVLFSLVGDPGNHVRTAALNAIADCRVNEQEAVEFERMLSRRASDLRRGVLTMLLNQGDEMALASARRLLAASEVKQRLAGLEMLREMKKANRQTENCRTATLNYRTAQKSIGDDEEQLLNSILEDDRPASLVDGLGLFDPEKRTRPTPPVVEKKYLLMRKKPLLATDAAVACLKSLDALVTQNSTTSFLYPQGEEGASEVLLGNSIYFFPRPKPNIPIEEDAERLPLRNIWVNWYQNRPPEARDDDGFELLRARAWFSAFSHSFNQTDSPTWLEKARKDLFVKLGAKDLQNDFIVQKVLDWLIKLYPVQGTVDFLLDAVEFSATLIPLALVPREGDESSHDWARDFRLLGWLAFARDHRQLCPSFWDDGKITRLWQCVRWIDEPAPGVKRMRPMLEETVAAFVSGAATEADVLDHFLGLPESKHKWRSFEDLSILTARKPSPLLQKYPFLNELVHRCRERIIEIETKRGVLPTEATVPVLALRTAGGLKTAVKVLRAFGRENFVRNSTYDSHSKANVLSDLIKITIPDEADTPEAFAVAMKEAGISEKRLVELAVYAPLWAGHVEHALGWPGLVDATLWILAHTKDGQWHPDREIREIWAAQIAERTPVPSTDLLNGAVDVAWFWQAYGLLGQERWDQLYDAAKYASDGAGHERARRFADAMLGQVQKSELVTRIVDKRHQDSVRALGLLPLAVDEEREQDVLDRYKVLQEFRRTSRKFGAQRQESEKLAMNIALDNLARTAGYRDPLRLQWAMETRTVGDLADGPLTVTVGDVTVLLAIDDYGKPDLAVTKAGKPLKAIPSQVKKTPEVVALQERQREVRRQGSRVRLSLEQAMCRGDSFTGAELRDLFRHPVLAPMLRGLVFVGMDTLGYPIERGLALEAHDGTIATVGESEILRVAHPHDLLSTGEWHLWQGECFRRERIQPFKQIFRELYVLTKAEQEDRTLSRRYTGHQVQARKAVALLGQRSWVNNPEEGIRKTYHEAGISAWLSFLGGTFTPADVEGLTIEGVGFSRYGDWKPLPLTAIPARIFSEVMRDVDLVVSVAHQGGVDPEASASTVEMRASLIKETCALLKIGNVRIQGNHALIEGSISSYSVHLGSAVVHQLPGGSLCIVPVHAQHRGRLFLPFADDDPRTAEVLSKILLLAKDKEIKDPTILEQILA